MEKLDLKKQLRHLYGPGARSVVEVDVPTMNFLMIDGEGDPNTTQGYSEAVEALFALSYAIKFAVKRSPDGTDYGVMPLEGLWWADDMEDFATGNRSGWLWTMMVMQPDFVGVELVSRITADVFAAKGLPAIPRIRFEPFTEGLAAQVLHVGPFAEEAPTIERVHRYIEDSGALRVGKHHEIYLTDVRRADPARWKTVIRQPLTRSL
jgi:hypothetical protein